MGTEQGVAGHHADHRERNRRHDDQGHDIAAELRHHQQIDQHDPGGIGQAHVAEGLIGDLPFAVPLDGVTLGGHRLSDEALLHGLPLEAGITQLTNQIEHAVQRAVEGAGLIGGDVDDRCKILVVDGTLPRQALDPDQLGQRNQTTVCGAYPQRQQMLQTGLIAGRQAQANRHGVLGSAITQIVGIVTGDRPAERLCDPRLIDTEPGRPIAIDHQPLAAGLGRLDRSVDINDAVGVLEAFGQPRCQPAGLGIVRSVDLGNQWRQHRWARRHLHYLDRSSVAGGHVGQPRSHRTGDVVALATAIVAIDQIDLDIADMAALALIVLTHQSVEIDRRGSPDIALVVTHFRHRCQHGSQFQQHGIGLLQRAALGHVQHHLKLRLVVERQHLQHHPLHGGEPGRDQHQDGHPGEQDAPAAWTAPGIEKGREQPPKATVQRAANDTITAPGDRMPTQQLQGQPWRHRQRHRQRKQHADRGIDRNRPHVRPHQSTHEGHRQQGRNHREGGQDGRSANLIDGRRNRLGQRLSAQAHVPMDVLDHHDRVIDQDADREDQSEQRHPIDGESHRPGCKQGQGQGQHHRTADHHGLAATQCCQDQQHHRCGGEDQLLDQGGGLVVGGLAVVARYRDFDALGDQRALQRLDAGQYGARDVGCVAAGFLGHGHGHRRRDAIARPARLSVGHPVPDVAARQIGPALDVRHIAEKHRLAVVQADGQIGDLTGIGQKGAGGPLSGAIGRDPLAGFDHQIGRTQRLGDRLHGQSVGGQPGGIQGNQHGPVGRSDRVDVAGAGDALELGFQRMRHLRQLGGATCGVIGPQGQCQHRHIIDAHRGHQRLAHTQARRHPIGARQHLVPSPHDRRLTRHANLVLDRNHRQSRPADRVDVLDFFHFRQRLLQRPGNQILDILDAGTRKGHEHMRHGHIDLRFFLAWRDQYRDQAEQQPGDGQNGRERMVLKRRRQSPG